MFCGAVRCGTVQCYVVDVFFTFTFLFNKYSNRFTGERPKPVA